MTPFADLIAQGAGRAWFFIPSAILLGALHGLEPGHSKTLMAAFIVAVRGTVKQAVLLGLAATVSHTMVVWAIALGGMWLYQGLDAEAVEPYFQLLSGAIIILLALWMIWRTWSDRHAARAHSHDHDHGHHHDHDHDHGHSHDHDHGAAAGDSRTLDTGHGHVALALVPREGQRFWQFTALSGQFWAPGEVTVTAHPAQGGAERHYAFRVADGVLLSATPVDLPEDLTARLTLSHRGHAHHYDLAFGAADLAEEQGLDLGEEGYQDAHERAHAADIQRRFKGQTVTNGQILLFGLTGGLLPCPAAITVLLICLQLKEIPLGAVLVLCFSIGLALVLVGVGAAAAIGARRASRLSPRLAALAGRAPYLSGALIILVGLYVGAHGAAALLA